MHCLSVPDKTVTTKPHERFDNRDSLNIHDSIRKSTKFFNYVEISQNVFSKPQSPIVNNIEHYRNIYGSPENFIKRQFNYEKMKVFDEKFRKEIERRESFKNFPKDLEHLINSMAKSGFYYIGNKEDPDKVKCIFCQGILYKWNKTDVPGRDHKKSYPTCPFLLNLNVGNVPIEENGDKFLSNDPDLKYGDKILYNVFSTSDEISLSIPNQLEFDLETREKTFDNFEHLKDLSLKGLYVMEKEKINYLKCCECEREIEILKNIESLSPRIFHFKNCSFLNDNLLINNKSLDECEDAKQKIYCKVEYSITDEEIEARMDSRTANKIEKLGQDREKIKKVFINKMKSTGKDFESFHEILLDIENYSDLEIIQYNTFEEFIFEHYPCDICLKNPRAVIFLPCGHFKTCYICSKSLSRCHVCKKFIVKRVTGIRFRNLDSNF